MEQGVTISSALTPMAKQIQGTLVTEGLNETRRRIQTLQAQDRIPLPHRAETSNTWYFPICQLS